MIDIRLSKYSRLGDLLHIGADLDLPLEVLNEADSKRYIDQVFIEFQPLKTWGHVQLGRGESLAPSEKYQNIYSLQVNNSPLFLIFDQNHREDRNRVLKVRNGSDLAKLITENGSLEYFLSDENHSFLIAVNYYSIEYLGDISFSKEKLDELSELG